MEGCMKGVSIVELGHVVAVPSAAAILADWGANVIKVESPGTGDQARTTSHLEGGSVINKGINYTFEVMNRNKRGITLNLKTEQGRNIMYQMIRKADVFMSNFQHKALEQFGLAYEQLSDSNPRLIYATVTGYGPKGPKKDKPGYDYAAFWAHSGLMDKFSDPSSMPRRQRPGIGDNTTSLCIVSGISAALFAREKTGRGQELSFSLYNTAMWALQSDVQVALAKGEELPYSDIKKASNPLWNAYQTKDRRWLELTMIQSDLFWPRFCRATGLQYLEHDSKFKSHHDRMQNNEALIAIIGQALRTKNLVDWEQIFDKEEIFCSSVQTITEVINDTHAIANDFFLEIDHPVLTRLRLVASPVLFDGSRPPIQSPAPALGQHTEEVLLEFGYTWDDIAAFHDAGVI